MAYLLDKHFRRIAGIPEDSISQDGWVVAQNEEYPHPDLESRDLDKVHDDLYVNGKQMSSRCFDIISLLSSPVGAIDKELCLEKNDPKR